MRDKFAFIEISEVEMGDELLIPLGGGNFRGVRVLKKPVFKVNGPYVDYGTVPCFTRDIVPGDMLDKEYKYGFDQKKRWLQLPNYGIMLVNGSDI